MEKMSTADLLARCLAICKRYHRDGLTLTARTLYYRLVAAELIPNSQESYRRVVTSISKARLAGKFPLDLIQDNLRSADVGLYTRNDMSTAIGLHRALGSMSVFPRWLIYRDRWWGQKTHVSVWVEKDAQSSTFEGACHPLGVSLLVCRGYPSHSGLYDWLRKAAHACGYSADDCGINHHAEHHEGTAEKAVVLYFGDHDPDGLMIPRAAEEVVKNFQRQQDWEFPIEFHRIALTMAQIQQYNPPSFPGKEGSPRFKRYVKETGTTEAWELEALDPATLKIMIEDAVALHFDQRVFQVTQEAMQEERARFAYQFPRYFAEQFADQEWVEDTFQEYVAGYEYLADEDPIHPEDPDAEEDEENEDEEEEEEDPWDDASDEEGDAEEGEEPDLLGDDFLSGGEDEEGGEEE